MSSLASSLQDLFGTANLYEVLDVDFKSSTSMINRAYKKKSLVFHPQGVTEEEKRSDLEKRFRALGAIHSVLSDANRRAAYDQTGEIDHDVENRFQEKNWEEYWRCQFKRIVPLDVKNFEEEYRHTEEELNDLKDAYLDGEGSMDFILSSVPCCSEGDKERYSDIIMGWIEATEVPLFKTFREKQLENALVGKLKPGNDMDRANSYKNEDELLEQILNLNQNQDETTTSFLDKIAAEYGVTKQKNVDASKK